MNLERLAQVADCSLPSAADQKMLQHSDLHPSMFNFLVTTPISRSVDQLAWN